MELVEPLLLDLRLEVLSAFLLLVAMDVLGGARVLRFAECFTLLLLDVHELLSWGFTVVRALSSLLLL